MDIYSQMLAVLGKAGSYEGQIMYRTVREHSCLRLTKPQNATKVSRFKNCLGIENMLITFSLEFKMIVWKKSIQVIPWHGQLQT